MASLADYERDYWAPDRDAVLEQMRAQAPAAPPPSSYQAPPYYSGLPPNVSHNMQYTPQQQQYDTFAQDYWAPDREQVLSSMRPPGAGNWWGAQGGPTGGGYGGGWWPGGSGNFQGAPGGGGAGGGNQNPYAFFQSLTQGKPPTPDTLIGLEEQLGQQGIKVLRNAAGVAGKIQLPNGQIVDVIEAAGLGGKAWQWDTGPGGGGTSGFESYGGGIPGFGGFQSAPNATPFSYEKFVAPDALTMMNDPGYKERMRLGTDAVERSAAAKGQLLTGGTLKDLNDYAQTFASNEFQNVYNRALGSYMTNYQTAFEPWQANFNNAYQSWLGNFNAANTQWQNQLAAQQQRYGQLFGNAQLGAGMVGGLANAGQGYANSVGNILTNQGNQAGELLTGQGNAQAAGRMGSANAWANAVGGIGDTVTNAMLWSYLGGQGQGKQGGPVNGYTTGGGIPYAFSNWNIPKANVL